MLLAGSLIQAGVADAQGPKASRPRVPAKMTTEAITYEAVPFASLPGWTKDDQSAALKAFVVSCDLAPPPGREMAGRSVVQLAATFAAACSEARKLGTLSPKAARAFFERWFQPYAMQHKGSQGLLTGYYEPLLHGSRVATAKFNVPIYRRPSDLVNLVDESQRGAKGASLTHGRKTATGIVTYPTREQIDRGALKGKGLELLYLADPVDLFFMQIQGSGRVQLTDGTSVRISYDGKNGHPYTSIGRYLIDAGVMGAEAMSLEKLSSWLKADLARAWPVMWKNASYVFFRELSGAQAAGPLGVHHIPLTEGRSLAVDAGYHTIGFPVYVSAPTLTHAVPAGGFERLMIAQDVGSAIRGPERGDIFFGSGDDAGRRAGITKHAGRFYVLLPRDAPADPSVAAPAAQPTRTSRP